MGDGEDDGNNDDDDSDGEEDEPEEDNSDDEGQIIIKVARLRWLCSCTSLYKIKACQLDFLHLFYLPVPPPPPSRISLLKRAFETYKARGD